MLSLLTLTGCGATNTAATVEVRAVCGVWPTTPYSKNDTPETKKGNQLNNARHDGFCR